MIDLFVNKRFLLNGAIILLNKISKETAEYILMMEDSIAEGLVNSIVVHFCSDK
jgi:hypothetical protein